MNESTETIGLLVVEDNAGDALLLTDMLREAVATGDVSVVDTLAAAEASAVKSPPDVILLDLSLPDSSGTDTVRSMVEAAPLSSIVVMTGLADQEAGRQAIRAGAQDYLVKGRLSVDLLARTISHSLERQRMRQELKGAHDGVKRANDSLEQKVLQRTADLAGAVEELQGEVRERVAAQGALERTNRSLRMLIEANEAMVRIHDEQELIHAICRIVVERGGYVMAWVGFAQQDSARTVLPAGSVGLENGYLRTVRITWADEPLGRGPTGTAIRTGKVAIGRDFLSDPQLAPWKQAALARGFRSSIALPLLWHSVTGALTIYAAEPDAFGDEIVEILSQLANDLTYGIAALRGAAERGRLEREVLQAAEQEQWRIGRDLHDSVQGSLTGIKMMLAVIENRSRSLEPDLGDEVRKVADLVQQTLVQTRALSHGLCPMDLHGQGLVRGLEGLCGSIDTLFRLKCRFHCDHGLLIEDEAVGTQVYYIAQEAINNAIKHSKGKSISVTLARTDGQVVLSVQDDGVGIGKSGQCGTGIGMRTMSYRACMIGATLEIGAGAAGGTIVKCSLKGMP
jgi:signal transduction histidine kinase